MVKHKIFQNIRFSVGIETKDDPLNIPFLRFGLIFQKKVRSKKYQESQGQGFFFVKVIERKYVIRRLAKIDL